MFPRCLWIDQESKAWVSWTCTACQRRTSAGPWMQTTAVDQRQIHMLGVTSARSMTWVHLSYRAPNFSIAASRVGPRSWTSRLLYICSHDRYKEIRITGLFSFYMAVLLHELLVLWSRHKSHNGRPQSSYILSDETSMIYPRRSLFRVRCIFPRFR